MTAIPDSGWTSSPVTHEFAGSGIDMDRKHYWRCACGWESDLVDTVQEAAGALGVHLTDARSRHHPGAA
jgi:hypothetical protein